ncbi:MAG: signal peptidase I [bacterium]
MNASTINRISPRKSVVKDYAEILVISVLLALFIRTFVVQAFQIPSGSMEDTLLVGDFLLANKFLYGAKIPYTDVRFPAIRHPKSGDIIVFRAPHQDKDFIKRCVAVGGDTVELRDNKLFVNGEPVDEPHLAIKGRTPAVSNFGPLTVPQGYLFMLGDNRNNSQDSRFWGPLDEKLIKGKAMVLYLSWDKERSRPRFSRIGDIIR